jgi:hypothetical protein
VVSNPDAGHIGGFLDVFDALGHRPRSATHGSGAWATGCFETHVTRSLYSKVSPTLPFGRRSRLT